VQSEERTRNTLALRLKSPLVPNSSKDDLAWFIWVTCQAKQKGSVMSEHESMLTYTDLRVSIRGNDGNEGSRRFKNHLLHAQAEWTLA
jgi:hypothetical protein